MIRDFYHKYTVDEHSLLAIKNIEDLLTTNEASDLRFRSLLLESPDAGAAHDRASAARHREEPRRRPCRPQYEHGGQGLAAVPLQPGRTSKQSCF